MKGIVWVESSRSCCFVLINLLLVDGNRAETELQIFSQYQLSGHEILRDERRFTKVIIIIHRQKLQPKSQNTVVIDDINMIFIDSTTNTK